MQAPIQQRRGYDTNVDDVAARRGQSVDQRVAQLLAARPIVATHRDCARDPFVVEIQRVGPAEGLGDVCREIAADDAADVILPENAGRDSAACHDETPKCAIGARARRYGACDGGSITVMYDASS